MAPSAHYSCSSIDQMEELLTSQEVKQANTFLTALYHAVPEKALWVIPTIRSDHLQYCYRHPEMVKVLRRLATGREFHDFWRAKESATPLMRAYLDVSRRARWFLDRTAPVGSKNPNGVGLYQMSGNGSTAPAPTPLQYDFWRFNSLYAIIVDCS